MELYRELVVGSASDPLGDRLGWSMEGVRLHWNWTPGSASWTIPSSRSLVGFHGTRCPLSAWITKRAWQTCQIVLSAPVASKKRLSTPSTTASEFVRFGIMSESGRPASNPNSSYCTMLVTSWTMFQGFKVRSVWCFFVIQAAARMKIWTTRKKGLYDDANFSHRDLILYFRHQLRVKIRRNRKRLDRLKVGTCCESGRRKRDNVGVILPSSSCA